MIQAFSKKISAVFSSKFKLLIVVALFFGGKMSHALPSKTKGVPVDNASSDAFRNLSGEHLLYSKVIDSYRSKNLSELNRAVELMTKAYPRSVHTDNALYLKADLTLERGQFQNSLDTIETLLKNYPDSDKRVSALYLKSRALQQTKQPKAAQFATAEIQTRYPGSIEAAKIYSQRTLQK